MWKNGNLNLKMATHILSRILKLNLIMENIKVSKHPYRLFFMKGTIVQEHELPQIPYHVYQFTSFEDIISGHASPNVLVGNS